MTTRRRGAGVALGLVLLALARAPCARAQDAAPAPAGRIAGSVEVSPVLSVRKPRIRLYGDYGPGAIPPPRPPSSELGNIVIYLDSIPWAGEVLPGAPRPRIEQKDETFIPHVLPVLRGSTVDFPNDDPVFHNVFSLSGVATFDLGRYPKGASKAVHFERAGLVQVFCHIHSDMSAVVLVLANPFFAVPANGRFTIENVPVGEYRLVAWHERVKPIVYHVRVEAGQTTTLDVSVPVPSPGEAARP